MWGGGGQGGKYYITRVRDRSKFKKKVSERGGEGVYTVVNLFLDSSERFCDTGRIKSSRLTEKRKKFISDTYRNVSFMLSL